MERVLHDGLAPEGMDLLAEDDVRAPAVDGQAYAQKTGDGAAKGLDEQISGGDVPSRDDEHDHQTAASGGAGHDMTDKALARGLVVGARAAFFHPVEHGKRRVAGIEALDAAALRGKGDEVVAARGEEAAGGLALHLGDGVCAFVAVGERLVHAQNRRNGDIQPADAAEQLLHLILLEAQGGFIGHMLAGAAAAALIHRTERLGALGAFGQELVDAAEGVALFGLHDADKGALAGQKARHEHGHALMAAYALRVLAEALAGHFKYVVFAQHNSSG